MTTYSLRFGQPMRPTVKDDSLWDTDQCAGYLNASPRTVRDWQMAGHIPFVKIVGLVRYVPDEVRAWALTQRSEPTGRDEPFVLKPATTSRRGAPGRKKRSA